MESAIYDTLLESADAAGADAAWYLPYPLGFQVSLASFLLLEILLGCGGNLAALGLYCAQAGLVDSVSNVVTVNLHVLDTLLCLVCAPLTLLVLLLPLERHAALLCCFHEACVTFSSVATAANVLVIGLDRYDISVRPARRLLTPSRAGLLLAAVWLLSLLGFLLPFLETQLVPQNRTALCVSPPQPRARLAPYAHLFLQIPAFFAAGTVTLLTYARVLRALNIHVGGRLPRSQRHKSKRRKRRKASEPHAGAGEARRPAQPPQPMRVQASVSAIVALRRAVRRHRDRRERQRRVFKMSLIIVSTFLVCWAPVSIANLLVLCVGPSPLLLQLRLCFLALAYGTAVFHPLLYAFARQKCRAALRSRLAKRVVSVLQVDPAPGGAVIHNSWVEPPKGRQAGSSQAQRSLAQGLAE